MSHLVKSQANAPRLRQSLLYSLPLFVTAAAILLLERSDVDKVLAVSVALSSLSIASASMVFAMGPLRFAVACYLFLWFASIAIGLMVESLPLDPIMFYKALPRTRLLLIVVIVVLALSVPIIIQLLPVPRSADRPSLPRKMLAALTQGGILLLATWAPSMAWGSVALPRVATAGSENFAPLPRNVGLVFISEDQKRLLLRRWNPASTLVLADLDLSYEVGLRSWGDDEVKWRLLIGPAESAASVPAVAVPLDLPVATISFRSNWPLDNTTFLDPWNPESIVDGDPSLYAYSGYFSYSGGKENRRWGLYVPGFVPLSLSSSVLSTADQFHVIRFTYTTEVSPGCAVSELGGRIVLIDGKNGTITPIADGTCPLVIRFER